MTITLQQAIAARGIDEKKAMTALRRRHPLPTGRASYTWPSSALSHWDRDRVRAIAAMRDVAYAEDGPGIRTYCTIWAELNHLKECLV